jgi:hypothetical protein
MLLTIDKSAFVKYLASLLEYFNYAKEFPCDTCLQICKVS